MALSVVPTPCLSYPVGVPFRITGTGAFNPQWQLENLDIIQGNDIGDHSLIVTIPTPNSARAIYFEQGGPKEDGGVYDFEYITDGIANCKSDTDHNGGSGGDEDTSTGGDDGEGEDDGGGGGGGTCVCKCPIQNRPQPVLNEGPTSSASASRSESSAVDTTPAQQTCKQDSVYRSRNSLRVDRDFQATLFSTGPTIRTLGGALSMSFARPNGYDAPLKDGMPMGTGGGQGAHNGLYRVIYFEPDSANPNFATVNGFDGTQTSYYYSYDTPGGEEVWKPGPGMCNELRRTTGNQWREITCDRNYFEYDAQGRYYRKLKLNGAEVYFHYDNNNRVQRLSGDFPGEVYFSYDGNGNLSQVTQRETDGPLYRQWDYEYQNVSGLGQTLTKISGPEGCNTQFAYNSRGEVTKEADALNYTTYFDYTYFDQTGFRLSRVLPPETSATNFWHNRPTNSMTKVVAEPNLTGYYKSDFGINRMVESQFGLPSFPGFPSFPLFPGFPQTNFFGQSEANNEKSADRLGRSSYYAYDGEHNTVRQLDPTRFSTYFAYNSDKRLTKQVFARWQETGQFIDFTTYYDYDAQGNNTRIRDALGNTTLMDYARGGVMVRRLDARSKATYYGYDSFGRRERTLDAVQSSSYFGYDVFGNRLRSVGKRWPESGFADFTAYYEYDLLNRMTRMVDAEGDITEHDYSARCNEGPIATYQLVDGIWRASYFTYDSLRRQVRAIDPLNNASTMLYLGETSLVSRQSDKRGFGTYFAYDGLHRQRIMADALNNATYYDYDAVDNQVHLVTPRWRETGLYSQFTSYFGYDEMNRQVRALDPLGHSTYFGFDALGNQTRVVGKRWQESSFANFTTYYTFDRLNRQASMIDALGNTSRSGYDEVSNLVRQQDARGNATYFGYDPLNRRNAVVDAAGESTYFGYDAAGNQTRMVGPRWKESSFPAFSTYYEYDPVNRQAAVIDALNQKVYFAYDAAGNRRLQFDHITDTSFALTYFGYDVLDRLVKTVDALERTSYFEYDPNGNQTRAIQPGSPAQVTLNTYDPLNRLSETTSPFGAATYFSYDAESNLARSVGPRWVETNNFSDFASYFGYDALNRRVRSLDALQNSAYFGFDAGGNQVRSVDRRWKESNFAAFSTYFVYDRLERLTTTIDAQGSSFARTYDAVGNLTAQTPPVGGANLFGYDNRNLLTASVDGASDVSYFAYDAAQNRVRTVSPRAFLSYFGYDALNRLAKVLDAENGTAYFGYDIAGNTARVVDALARTTYFSYDKLDRLTQSIAANETSVEFFYDQAGNRNVATDQLDHSTYYFYDVGNRLTRERDPLGRTAYFGYDEGSNLARSFDRRGIATYFGYDALDRHIRVQFGRGYGQGGWGETPYGSPVHYFEYDAGGNLTRTLDEWGVSTLAYDTLNRLAKRATPRSDAVYYGYDAVNNLQRLQYPQGLAAAYFGYDPAQRLLQLRAPSGQSCYYLYDASSNVVKKRFGNLTACYYTFDKAERVTSIRHITSAGTPIVYFDYGRDVAGRILRIARENDLAVYYAYDQIDRLTQEVWRRQSDNVQVYAFFYDYDGANNRLKLRREFAAGTEWDSAYYSYAADNSLTQRRVQTPPATFVDTYYTYDANGSLSRVNEGGSFTYFEYHGNQLVSKIAPPGEEPTRFYYDARLNRYLIDKAGTLTYYLWDAGLNQLEERDEDGNLKARYTHGNYRLFGIGSVVEVQQVANSTTYFQYLHMDHRGTIYKVTDANQNTQLAYTQDAFGNRLAPIGGTNPAVPNDLIYQSDWLSLNIGGRQYGVSQFRLYDPTLAIFLQRDFLNYPNKYRAWSNNPVREADNNGLEVTDKPKQNVDYEDEQIGHTASRTLEDWRKDVDEETAKGNFAADEQHRIAMQNLLSLKENKCLTIVPHYIDGHDLIGQFALHSRGNNKCTISIYIGHAEGKEADANRDETGAKEVPIDKDDITKGTKWIKAVPANESLKEILADPNDRPPGTNPTSKAGQCASPKFGIYGCFARQFNETLIPVNRINVDLEKLPSIEIYGAQLYKSFNEQFDSLKKQIDEMCKCCENKVVLHLYFGSLGRARVRKLRDNSFNAWK